MLSKEENSPAYVFKICLIGSAGVGKTCIAKRLCFNTFDANTQLTIGIDFYTYNIPILIKNKENIVRLTIWDFGGQEQFKKLFGYYIEGANGIFLVFELTNIESLTKLSWWYEQIEKHNLESKPKILMGTKLDLVKSFERKNKIDDLIIEQFLNHHNVKDFYKTSSKENINIVSSFKQITRLLLDCHKLDYDEIL